MRCAPKKLHELEVFNHFRSKLKDMISEISVPLLFMRAFTKTHIICCNELVHWSANACVDHSKSNNNSILKQFRHNNDYCHRCAPLQTKRYGSHGILLLLRLIKSDDCFELIFIWVRRNLLYVQICGQHTYATKNQIQWNAHDIHKKYGFSAYDKCAISKVILNVGYFDSKREGKNAPPLFLCATQILDGFR